MKLVINCKRIRNNIYFNAEYRGISVGYLILDVSSDEYPRYKEYCNGDKLAKIVRIETNVKYVGQGIASTLIRTVINEFKDYNLILLCSPCKRYENVDTIKTIEDLELFYFKFNFIKTKELLPTMIHKANI